MRSVEEPHPAEIIVPVESADKSQIHRTDDDLVFSSPHKSFQAHASFRITLLIRYCAGAETHAVEVDEEKSFLLAYGGKPEGIVPVPIRESVHVMKCKCDAADVELIYEYAISSDSKLVKADLVVIPCIFENRI